MSNYHIEEEQTASRLGGQWIIEKKTGYKVLLVPNWVSKPKEVAERVVQALDNSKIDLKVKI